MALVALLLSSERAEDARLVVVLDILAPALAPFVHRDVLDGLHIPPRRPAKWRARGRNRLHGCRDAGLMLGGEDVTEACRDTGEPGLCLNRSSSAAWSVPFGV